MATLKYPEIIDGSSDYIKFKFFEYKAPYDGGFITGAASGPLYNRSAIEANLTPANLDEIVITMPNDIGSSITGNWGDRSFGGLTAAALGAVGGVTKLDNLTSNLGKFSIDAVKAAGTGAVEDILKTITNKISSTPGLGSNLQLNDYLGLVSGYITNPNTELLYQGTQLRNHGYTFKMIAQTETEAKAIDKIATIFKQAAAPKGNTAKFLNQDIRNFIGIPNVCRVSFHQGKDSTKEHMYLPRFKTSAITSVSVDYITEGQYMTFEDGRPIGLGLQVNFRELKLLFADEIGQGKNDFR